MVKRRLSRIGKKKSRPAVSFQMLHNPLTAGMLTDEAYSAYAADFIASSKPNEFRENFSKLYTKERFRSLFNASKIQLETFYSQGIFVQGLSYKRLLNLYSCIFEANSAEIRFFIAIRDKYESKVLLGEFDAALALLEELVVTQGESLWYIRNKITTLGMKGALQEMQEFAEGCKLRSKEVFITFLINCFLLIASDAKLHLEKLIKITIAELEQAGAKTTADLLSLLFVPRPLYGTLRPLLCIKVIQSFNFIDQYSLMVKLLPEEMEALADEDDKYNTLVEFSRTIQTCTRDHALSRLEAKPRPDLSNETLAGSLVRLYEQDNHRDLLDKFKESFDSDHTPFAFANLIAKAMAGSDTNDLAIGLGPVLTLIEHLQELYTLSAPPNKSEDNIAKVIIQLQGFVSSASLQLCLYKSMPQRYEQRDWVRLARIAERATEDTTPLGILLTTDADPVLTHKYLSGDSELPTFRKLKSKLQRSSTIDEKDIDALMAFSHNGARAKDIYETVSSCYLRTHQNEELIKLAGSALSVQPNAYIAFPMKVLITEIEATKNCSLDALIIIYSYVRKIDSSKEYLLNESYEEFIELNGANRPSDLLRVIGVQEEQSLVFFRDISTLETMDFLGSFSDSNDLRAERVRILDYLRDADRLGSERHRTEVDEIILQVIVDAGATEFNVAKIDVNDIAIRRNLSEDFSSLHHLYKSVRQEKEQQVIRFDDELLDGNTALVAGDKNTTLLKMLNLVEDAFMNDEKHGLDKNLSTEIRHGFFSNLMRSKLEESHLLTETDENGEYEPNVYWLTANALVVPELLLKIDSELKWFSRQFNDLIVEAEEWMKVSSDGGNPQRVFNYKTFLGDLEELKYVAEQADNSDFVLDFCITTLWNKTEICMQDMREKLNVELKSRVDNLFDELIDRINEVRSGVMLLELMRAIVQVKSDIREDITTASEWFRRSTEYAATARTISDLIDISIECFERVRGIRLEVNKHIEEVAEFRLEGRDLKAFIVAVVNILENACRHSGFAHNTPIDFEMVGQECSWQMGIKNKVVDEVHSALRGDKIIEIARKMKEPSSINMMKLEGGSGLGKAYNQLRSISTMFDMNVELVEDHFVAKVSYAN